MNNRAAPANVIAANPAIGAKSPVFAAFAFGVVDSCPVWVAVSSVDGVVSVSYTHLDVYKRQVWLNIKFASSHVNQ